jgi:hypothetical protein
VRAFRDKEEAGHEEPWYAYLTGDAPWYPVAGLAAAHAQARRRLALMERLAGEEVGEPDIHRWQDLNPVVTEVLTQLTWGAPQVVYNGGIAQARLRYYDADRGRPGLPPDVAALVSSIDPDATAVTLINVSGTRSRTVIVQAGVFAEHDIASARYETAGPGWTGSEADYAHREPELSVTQTEVGGPWLDIVLPPGCQISLTVSLRMRVRAVAMRTPWSGPAA